MNIAAISGRLVRDPELRTTQSGIDVISFTVAVQRRYKNAAGDYEADFISCVAWRTTAEFINKYFTKGKWIELEGTIQTRSWEADDGTKRYSTEIIADNVGFGGATKSDNASAGPAPAEPAYAPSDNSGLPFDL